MRLLVACEYSGIVRDAFRGRGIDAWSCDLLPTEADHTYHIKEDVLKILNQGWDMMIAHPPCTYIALCQVRWKYRGSYDDYKERQNQEMKALQFFRKLWECRIPRICIENPKSIASVYIAPKTQTIHPWQFGHPERKETWLWLKGLPLLKPTNDVYDRMMKLPLSRQEKNKNIAPSEDRSKIRSRTYQGIAEAMAEQWSCV